MRHPPYGFDIYLVNVKTIRRMTQIILALSEKLNFNLIKFHLNHYPPKEKILRGWILTPIFGGLSRNEKLSEIKTSLICNRAIFKSDEILGIDYI